MISLRQIEQARSEQKATKEIEPKQPFFSHKIKTFRLHETTIAIYYKFALRNTDAIRLKVPFYCICLATAGQQIRSKRKYNFHGKCY